MPRREHQVDEAKVDAPDADAPDRDEPGLDGPSVAEPSLGEPDADTPDLADLDLAELRRLLRTVMRGLWRRRRPPADLAGFLRGEPPISRRHVAMLVHIATEGRRTVGQLADELDLSLPAASKVARDLEQHSLLDRREDIDDKRRTVVDLNALSLKEVEAWLARREQPLRATLARLAPAERAAFLKGLRTLADELMKESACGPLRPDNRAPHRRRPHRDRPV